MRLGFVFPGQGSQYVGMGQDINRVFYEAAEIIGDAESCLGYDIGDICFFGPQEQLDKTEFAQPAILLISVALYELVKKYSIEPVVMAGLSLGEYTALVASGAMTLKEALPLVQRRGQLMQEAVPLGQGGMYAVIGMEGAMVEQICREDGGQVAVANYNAPGQVVIAGGSEDLKRVAQTLKKAGAKTTKLAMSVPSHSPLMIPAAEKLRPELEKVNWKKPEIPIVSNVTGEYYGDSNPVDLLVKQLYSPVLWEQSVRFMMDQVDYFVEIGPGKTLAGLIKRINKKKMLMNVEYVQEINDLSQKVDEYE